MERELENALSKAADDFILYNCTDSDMFTNERFRLWIRLHYGLIIKRRRVASMDSHFPAWAWDLIEVEDPEKFVMFKLKYG